VAQGREFGRGAAGANIAIVWMGAESDYADLAVGILSPHDNRAQQNCKSNSQHEAKL
jgi:hypothetical protein